MKTKELFHRVANLLLAADDCSKDWVKNPSLRKSWNIFLAWVLGIAGVGLLLNLTPAGPYVARIHTGAFWTRIGMAVLMVIALALLGRLAVAYYTYTIIGKRAIRLGNVLFFYAVGTVLFGGLYYSVFYAYPDWFAVQTAHIKWTSSLRGVDTFYTRLHFVIFSALTSAGASYPYIEGASVFVSVAGYIQKLCTFSLVALFVAGFVNQHARISPPPPPAT